MPDELAYIATKGAIEAFTVSLSPAVAPKGITVNAVNPGPVDAARLIAFLASDDAAWITGQVIHSEGGFIRG